MAPASRDDSAARVAERVHAVAIALLRRLRKLDAASGLSAPRLSALSVVVFAGPLTLGELAAAEQVKPPTMTRLVAALERLGHVWREVSEADARLTIVRASPKGIALLQHGRARRISALQARLDDRTASERTLLARATDILDEIVRTL